MKGSCITRFASNLNKSSQEREPSTNYNSTNTKMESKETETDINSNYVSMLQVKFVVPSLHFRSIAPIQITAGGQEGGQTGRCSGQFRLLALLSFITNQSQALLETSALGEDCPPLQKKRRKVETNLPLPPGWRRVEGDGLGVKKEEEIVKF